jgi:hypothetical protein
MFLVRTVSVFLEAGDDAPHPLSTVAASITTASALAPLASVLLCWATMRLPLSSLLSAYGASRLETRDEGPPPIRTLQHEASLAASSFLRSEY